MLVVDHTQIYLAAVAQALGVPCVDCFCPFPTELLHFGSPNFFEPRVGLALAKEGPAGAQAALTMSCARARAA